VKFHRVRFITAIVMIFAPVLMYSQTAGNDSSSAAPFLGRWDLTLKAPDREYPSWLEVQEQDGQLKAQFVGRWGNARPLPKVEVSDGQITFVSPKEEEGAKADLVFQGRLTGKTLTGTANGPDGKTWQWVGVRAPSLARATQPKWGKPIQLFNGKDLTGWTMRQTRSSRVDSAGRNPCQSWKRP
jgi:hypothetical protein